MKFIEQRFLINYQKQQEIGKILNISQSRVSVIKKRTLARLYKLLKDKK